MLRVQKSRDSDEKPRKWIHTQAFDRRHRTPQCLKGFGGLVELVLEVQARNAELARRSWVGRRRYRHHRQPIGRRFL